jgi:hypothetical protein
MVIVLREKGKGKREKGKVKRESIRHKGKGKDCLFPFPLCLLPFLLRSARGFFELAQATPELDEFRADGRV